VLDLPVGTGPEGIGLEERIILIWIFKKEAARGCTGFVECACCDESACDTGS